MKLCDVRWDSSKRLTADPQTSCESNVLAEATAESAHARQSASTNGSRGRKPDMVSNAYTLGSNLSLPPPSLFVNKHAPFSGLRNILFPFPYYAINHGGDQEEKNRGNDNLDH